MNPAETMGPADRRFYSWLLLLLGPLSVAGGFVFASTAMGAVYVGTGLSMMAAGVALRTSLPGRVVLALALSIEGALIASTALIYPGGGI